MPKYMNSDAEFASENVALRKKRIGIIGCSVRSSHATNAARNARPTVSEPTICGLAQPSAFPRIRPQTIPKRPTLARPRPGRSSLLDGP